MDPNQPFDFAELGLSTGIVAAVATVLILVFGLMAGAPRAWLRPKWAYPPLAWNGIVIFLSLSISYSTITFATMAAKQAGWYATAEPSMTLTLCSIPVRVLITPVIFAVCIGLQISLIGPITFPSFRRLAGRIALGAFAWFPLMLATTGVHLLTLWVKQELGGPIDVHPLAKLRPEWDGSGGVLFLLAVIGMLVHLLLAR